MRRLLLPGAWYACATPTGQWAALYPDLRLATSQGDLPLPPGGNLLYLRCAVVANRLRLIGQGHSDGLAWLWVDRWVSLGPTYGTSPCAFGPDGSAYVSQSGNTVVVVDRTQTVARTLTQAVGARGIAAVDPDGTVHSVDGWYGQGGFAEYTDLGDVRIGQGVEDGIVVRVGAGPVRGLEPGVVQFVRASTDGDQFSIAAWKNAEGGAVIHWATRAELAAVPLVPTPPPPVVPPPPVKPPEVPMPERKHLDVVQRIAATIPHERTLAYAWRLVTAVAWDLQEEGCGLHARPTGGENVMTVDGQTYGASRVMYPDGDLYKLVSDAGDGGANGPQWVREEPIDPQRWRPALQPADAPAPPDTPPTEPEPGRSLEDLWDFIVDLKQMENLRLEAIDDELKSINSRATELRAAITRLEQAGGGPVDLVVEGRTDERGVSYLKHSHAFTGIVKARTP